MMVSTILLGSVALGVTASMPLAGTTCPSDDSVCPSHQAALESIWPRPSVLVHRRKAVTSQGRKVQCEEGCYVTSLDSPPSAAVFPPAPLAVEVQITPPGEKTRKVECVELFLDGKLHKANAVVKALRDTQVAEFELTLPPGVHSLEARYRIDNRWSAFSQPLGLDVRFPKPPVILSVSHDILNVSEPLPGRDAVTIHERTFLVRLANVQPTDQILVYLDGRLAEDEPQRLDDHLTLAVTLRNPPGYYSLSMAAVPAGCDTRLASHPSTAVTIHFQPSNPDEQSWRRLAGTVIQDQRVDDRHHSLAFDVLPDYQIVGSRDQGGCPDGSTSAGADAEGGATAEHDENFRFLAPAHFPLRRFGEKGEVIQQGGAVIYEGMEFCCSRDGKYRVAFVVHAPALPTSLHLRFLVQKDDSSWQTVTLPPIELKQEGVPPDQYKPAIYRVQHCGYSAALDRNEGPCRTVRREGSARFGFGPALVRAQ